MHPLARFLVQSSFRKQSGDALEASFVTFSETVCRFFDWGGRKISEETDGHFQNISFLQLGVTCVVFANKGQNEALQMIETVIDASTSSLLQQGLQSLSEFVGLFSLSHSGPRRKRLIGLSSDAGTHFVCCLLLCFLGRDTCSRRC